MGDPELVSAPVARHWPGCDRVVLDLLRPISRVTISKIRFLEAGVGDAAARPLGVPEIHRIRLRAAALILTAQRITTAAEVIRRSWTSTRRRTSVVRIALRRTAIGVGRRKHG